MKFGFFMMPLHHPSENPTLAFERDLDFIEYVDHLGFDECFIGEHHSAGWETIPAPDIFIAMAAARAKRITLGTGVINLPYHHPFHVAERMAFLDHLTRGRLVMGVGPGVLATDLMLFGLPVDQVRPMSSEALDIIIRLLESDGPITYEGKYWQLKEMEIQVKSYQQPRLPIAMASSGSMNSLQQAGKYGLPVWSLANSPIASSVPLPQQWSVIEEAANKAGRQVSRDDWRLVHYVHVAESKEKAMEDISEGILQAVSYNFGNGSQGQFLDYPEQPFSEVTAEQVVRNREWIVGDPDEVTREIRALFDQAGGAGGLLITINEWAPVDKMYRNLELFARYVMPALQGTSASIQRAWEKTQRWNEEGIIAGYRQGMKRSDGAKRAS
ncbi:MAG: LLM class flavin-dependent oxidoreductase [Dehalococcoidia bacterium]|nr:LLM class flavin-dependent oxidoreductase [Chloroflexota bacterium]MCZ6865871.1 LLM class flavin-dependent oxidoreductase [Chloroflexota bacterium]